MRVVVLGCGGSSGTPNLETGWGQCDPNNPKNKRLRPSILVVDGKTRLLVDTSPDLRAQLLKAEVSALDGVFFTHAHSDHLHGVDDIRGINRLMNQALPAYGEINTLNIIRERFAYVFEPLAPEADNFYKATLIPNDLEPGNEVLVNSVRVQAFAQDHGYTTTLGLRFNDFAYTTDLIDISDHGFDVLAGVGTWMIGVFTDKPHPTHAHVDLALEWIERVKPKRAILTHMSNRLDYDALTTRLPKGVDVAYDGMVIDV